MSKLQEYRRTYRIARAFGHLPHTARLIAAAGVKDLQSITKVYEN